MARVIKVEEVVGAQEGDLRVWWISNPPAPATYTLVDSREDAVQSIQQLTELDLEDPAVESNVCGMGVFEDGDWTEWYDEDGNDIDYWLDLDA